MSDDMKDALGRVESKPAARGLFGVPGLQGPGRTNTPGHYVLFSYHDPKSLTWSWLLSWWFTTASWLPWWKVLFGLGPRRFSIRIPFVGMLSWQMQRKMPFSRLIGPPTFNRPAPVSEP
jgi:hypothetical protein